MKNRTIGWLSLVSLVVSLAWLVLLIVSMSTAGRLDTFEQVLAYVSRQDALYTLTYANASLIPILVSALFAMLYLYLRRNAPGWAFVGIIFVPVYATFSFIAYVSQLSVVPTLLELSKHPQLQAGATLALRMTIQQWNGSAVWVFNNLAYAVLGIPSLIFGALMYQGNHKLRWAGALLALNGIACILGMFGILAKSAWLSGASVLGGVFFILALIPMSRAFLFSDKNPFP
jgi:hypothetical protein